MGTSLNPLSPSLSDLSELNDASIDLLGAKTISGLIDHLTSLEKRYAGDRKRLIQSLERKYADHLGATPGTHTIIDGDLKIKFTRTKRVAWDQDLLAEAKQVLVDIWGEDPTEYIDTKLSVSESKYKAWPTAIQKLFTGARTVKAGATTIKFTAVEEK